MAKVVMFMRCEMFSGERERNEEYRGAVRNLVSCMMDGEVDYFETTANTPGGIARVFESNPDCEVVFTCANDSDPQVAACERGIMVFEYRFYTTKKLVPVRNAVEAFPGGRIFHKDHYSFKCSEC